MGIFLEGSFPAHPKFVVAKPTGERTGPKSFRKVWEMVTQQSPMSTLSVMPLIALYPYNFLASGDASVLFTKLLGTSACQLYCPLCLCFSISSWFLPSPIFCSVQLVFGGISVPFSDCVLQQLKGRQPVGSFTCARPHSTPWPASRPHPVLLGLLCFYEYSLGHEIEMNAFHSVDQALNLIAE